MGPRVLTRLFARIFRILFAPFVRFEFRGGACLRDHPTWILSANHRSVFDFPLAVVGLAHFDTFGRIMIASEFWRQPLWRWGADAVGAIPVYRTADPRGSLSAALAALQSGDSICIMPEGTLTWDPATPLSMGRVKSGVSRLAVGADVPVMPIALVGTEQVWPKGAKVPRLLGRRKVVVLRLADEPLWLSGDDHRHNATMVKAASESLIREATADLRAINPRYLPGLPAGG